MKHIKHVYIVLFIMLRLVGDLVPVESGRKI